MLQGILAKMLEELGFEQYKEEYDRCVKSARSVAEATYITYSAFDKRFGRSVNRLQKVVKMDTSMEVNVTPIGKSS